MEPIRVFRREDIPEVVALRRRAFRHTERPADEDLAYYYQRVFFESPWTADDLPSLVYRGGDGRLVGFIGIVPRPMAFGEETLRAVVTTEFMVDPDRRGVAGAQLMKRALAGPQDLSLSDRANDLARGIWESLGGETAIWYSLYWKRVLRQLTARTVDRPLVRVLRPLTSALDSAIRRRTPINRPPGTVEDLADSTVMDQLPRLAGRHACRPVYDPRSWAWLLARLSERPALGRLRGCQVRSRDGAVIGWFLYVMGRTGSGEAVQMAAHVGHEQTILDHLVAQVSDEGGLAIGGRLNGSFARPLSDPHYSLRLGQPWVLVHARRSDLLRGFQSGRALLSRLDAEWWIGA